MNSKPPRAEFAFISLIVRKISFVLSACVRTVATFTGVVRAWKVGGWVAGGEWLVVGGGLWVAGGGRVGGGCVRNPKQTNSTHGPREEVRALENVGNGRGERKLAN